jgi:Ca-activated chloride channel family protein
MIFADSWMFWLLVPLFVLWAAAWIVSRALERRTKVAATSALRFSSIKNLRALSPSSTLFLRRAVQGLRLVTIALLCLAMARPQTGRTETRVNTEGVDIVLVIDTSGSMQARDLDHHVSIARRRHRLQVVKDVVASFVEKRENDQIGIVVFGEQAFTQCPLTLDHGIVATFLEQIDIGMAGDQTAIGSALGIAVKRLLKSEAKSKVIILLTDGLNNAGQLSPITAAEVAKANGIKVYTIGAGTRDKAPFLVETMFGTRVQLEDVAIDEATLERIAQLTGGAYFRAEDASALEKIYEKIDELERTEIEMTSYQEYEERFAWFVIPALALLLLEVLLLGTRFRKIP